MEALVDPVAEWRQMFADAYRFERDYFYDPTLHGVDWKATRDRYARLIDASVTRWDVNFVLGEFIAELNASHTYNGGGDLETRAGARARGCWVWTGRWPRAPIASSASWVAARGMPTCARRWPQPGVEREGGRLRAGRERHAARHQPRPVGGVRGPGRCGGRADGQQQADRRGRAPGARQVPAERDRVALPRVDRAAAQARGRGDRWPRGLRLRAEHGRRRAERAGAAVHGAVAQGRPGGRRTLQQRRPDSRSVHRAAEPADAGVLGRARRRVVAVAAGGAPRARR